MKPFNDDKAISLELAVRAKLTEEQNKQLDYLLEQIKKACENQAPIVAAIATSLCSAEYAKKHSDNVFNLKKNI